MGTLTMILDNFSLVFRDSQTPRKSLEKVKADRPLGLHPRSHLHLREPGHHERSTLLKLGDTVVTQRATLDS